LYVRAHDFAARFTGQARLKFSAIQLQFPCDLRERFRRQFSRRIEQPVMVFPEFALLIGANGGLGGLKSEAVIWQR
jgi:hypothetical protein